MALKKMTGWLPRSKHLRRSSVSSAIWVEVAEQTLGSKEVSKDTTALYPGFLEKVADEIVLCDAENINADGIYPGKYTYQDNVPVDTMAKVCMENYDSKF